MVVSRLHGLWNPEKKPMEPQLSLHPEIGKGLKERTKRQADCGLGDILLETMKMNMRTTKAPGMLESTIPMFMWALQKKPMRARIKMCQPQSLAIHWAERSTTSALKRLITDSLPPCRICTEATV